MQVEVSSRIERPRHIVPEKSNGGSNLMHLEVPPRGNKEAISMSDNVKVISSRSIRYKQDRNQHYKEIIVKV